MRKNLPVVDREVKVRDDQMIVSRTNLKGVIDYVNKDFLAVSGFTEAELIGKAHNIVRHPDMPEVAFADLWTTLKAGRPWTGLVKNRCKDGAYYWVLARANPILEDGKVVAYLSVRTRPSQAQIDQAEALYQSIREGRARGIRLAQGAVVSASWAVRLAERWRDAPLALRAGVLSVPAALLALACALALLTGIPAQAIRPFALASTALAALQLICLPWLVHSVSRPLREIREVAQNIAAGDFNSAVAVQRSDEIGALQQAISTMQTRLGFEIAETRRIADENLRVRSALDASSANVMLADADGTIRYLNPAVQQMFGAAQGELRTVLPDFQVDRLIGQNFDRFHRNPAHQRDLLAGLTATYRTQIKVAGRSFALTANPIRTAKGERLGTVVEWQDRTLEVATEQEVSAIVSAAAAGDFSRRLALGGKQGFFAQLAEGINRLLDINSKGLSEVSGVLAAVAAGNLTRKAEGDFQGTFAQLTQDCNLTVERLIAIVRQIREGTDTINIAAREIAVGNDDLARRTEEQSNALEQTAAALEELTSTVKQNAESASHASRLVGNTSKVAQDGGAVVAQVIETMSSITASSRKISDIIAVIDGIAFQTNILALNAAVEAARAGEEGRGFAVVAGEVRGLASRSAAAAKEIKALIGDSVASVESGARLVDAAGRTMAEIVDSVNGVNGIVAAIAGASQEQAVGIEQINFALTQMDNSGEQNAALVEQASAAAKSMADQTERLSQAVSVFRTA